MFIFSTSGAAPAGAIISRARSDQSSTFQNFQFAIGTFSNVIEKIYAITVLKYRIHDCTKLTQQKRNENWCQDAQQVDQYKIWKSLFAETPEMVNVLEMDLRRI